MVSITLSIPEEIKKLMNEFPEMNWSGFIRKSIEEKARMLTLKEEMLNSLEKEKAFNDWTVELGRKAKKGRLKRLAK